MNIVNESLYTLFELLQGILCYKFYLLIYEKSVNTNVKNK